MGEPRDNLPGIAPSESLYLMSPIAALFLILPFIEPAETMS